VRFYTSLAWNGLPFSDISQGVDERIIAESLTADDYY
jgi:hypothetical protein